METPKALELARSRELDLVEVAPREKPPVCKIMSWSKFKYDLSKKRKVSSKGKSKELKEMWFSPYIGDGDIKHKLKKVKEFLGKKHPVKITIRVRGRVQKEAVTAQLDKITSLLDSEYETGGRPRQEGRNLALIIFPKKSTSKSKAKKK